MILRIFCAILGLVVISSSRAQESPTVPTTRSASTVVAAAQSPISPPPATISPEKLSDAQEIARALANGKAQVIVILSPPAALARTDFASKASRGVLRAEIKKLQQDVLDRVPANDVKAGHRFDNIAGFSAEVSANGLRALQGHPQVVLIEPVVMLKAHLAQGIPLMHGMTHRSNYNGAGMAIAICDSGVDYNHPRLGGGGFPNNKVIGGYNFGDNSPDPAPQGESHGTACAGIAAGSLGTVGDYIGGVAYNSKIYALKITSGPGGTSSTADMVAAWDWCVTHKDDDPNNPIMVISTSFGGGQYFATCDTAFASLTAAANNAVAAGITVLASSGNEGYCNAISSPSCITSVISVGAVYDASFGHYLPCIEQDSCAPKISTTGCATGWYANDTTAPDKVTSYANVAPFLTLLAPGNQCYTLDIVGSAGYSSGDYFSAFGGTSASCPYAAGAVACLQSAAKALTGNYLTPQEIRNRLTATGDNITDTKVAITRPRVNLERAFSPGFNVVSATLIGGNGNQSVDPNECGELRVVLRNDGFATATNIFATLTASIPGLSLIQQSSSYPNLAPGATGTNVTLFRFSTAPSFVCGSLVNFALAVTSSGSTNVATFGLISGSTNYVITPSSSASITAGTTDIGNHGDDTITSIALPFAFTFYGQTFSNAAVSGNGNLQFMSASSSAANSCLPVAGFANTIFAFWDDLRTDGAIGTAQGIFTSISGIAPNRIFNIEWRASYYHPGGRGNPVNFEVRLYENLSRFDLVYGTLNGSGPSATVGSQKEPGGAFTQFECNSGGLSSGLQLAFQTVCTDGGGACVVTPTVNFTGGPRNGAVPLTVNFTNLTTGATNYSWNFGDGNTSTATNPGNIYSTAGNYSVTLTAIGSGGTNALTQSNYIVVTSNPAPIADFTAEPTNGVAPLLVVFTNLSGHSTGFAWDFGDGHTSTNASPTNVYNSQGSYTVTLTVTGAGGTNTLAQTNYIVLGNSPPTFAAISNQIVIEETLLTFTALATDADANQHLTFSLDTNAPAGAQISSTNGVFTWTPTQTQAGSTKEITAIATDDGVPPLRATQMFTVIVLKTNHAPVLAPIADRTVHVGTTVVITNAATDSDLPPDTLTFSLDPGAPPASFIDPATGIFTWTPGDSQALTTNAITARVSDNGAPSMSDAKTFTITVISQPEILSITLSNEVATIVWSAIVGQGYRLQFKGDLNGTNWSDALPDVIATGPAASKDNSLDGVPQRYYRILVR